MRPQAGLTGWAPQQAHTRTGHPHLEHTSHLPCHDDDTALDTPLLRYTVTHQEPVETNIATHTPTHRIGPRGAQALMCPAKLPGHGYPQRFWPDHLATTMLLEGSWA